MRIRALTKLGIALVAAMLVAACSPTPPKPLPPDSPIGPVVAAVVKGITTGSLDEAPSTAPRLAAADYEQIGKGMDGVLPEVIPGEPRYHDDMAHVPLNYRWKLPGGDWTYQVDAPFVVRDQRWVLQWSPAVIHPDLTAETRLVHTRTPAKRGSILGRNGAVLMSQMPVLRLGLDKTRVDPDRAADSARRLATLLKIDPDSYVDRVRGAGEQAFVEALVVRGPRTGIDQRYGDIPGAVILDDERILSTEKGLASEILGAAGPATAEVIKKSKGKVSAGDIVGLSGLQQRYDELLSGRPGSTVSLAPRPPVVIDPTGAPSAGAGTQPPAAEPSLPPETGPRPVVFEHEPTRGTDLRITLDLALQRKAEAILADQKSPTAMAVLDPSTGAALVLAVSDSAQGQPLATMARYAPGSTFKIVTSLALFRAGLTPNSMVDCPQRTVVDGRVIENYDDFPASRVGKMRLIEAVALSCNTAFVNERRELSGPKLRGAAISLGMGQDHDAGFPSFYGSVPDPANIVGLAEASFGQGTVQASPMSMAAVAASVSAGRTTVPYLISDNRPEQDGKPLTAAEAKGLRMMMSEVVKSGSGRKLRGLVTGAKTGTAEYGTDKPPRTHAWMMAYTNDLAIAVMVTDGPSGSRSAAPLIKQFLS